MTYYNDEFDLVTTLVPGTIHGHRRWNVDRFGRLHSPSQEFIWKPGENVAQCDLDTNLYHHEVGRRDCGCGFYAYFDRKSSFIGHINGVVESYGKVTAGTKGFRAQKAKVVGIVRNKQKRNIFHKLWDIYGRAYYWTLNFGGSGWRWIFLCFGLGFLLPTFLAWNFLDDFYGVMVPVTLVFLHLLGFLAAYHVDTECTHRSKVPWDLIQRNYPDVKFFSSASEAMKYFDIKPIADAKVRTPEDEDFWDFDSEILAPD